MLLTVAVGNTNIHLGVFAGTGDHAVLVRDWRIHTDPYLTADELAGLRDALLALAAPFRERTGELESRPAGARPVVFLQFAFPTREDDP